MEENKQTKETPKKSLKLYAGILVLLVVIASVLAFMITSKKQEPCNSWTSETGRKFENFTVVAEYMDLLSKSINLTYILNISDNCAEYDDEQCIRYNLLSITLGYDNRTEEIARNCIG